MPGRWNKVFLLLLIFSVWAWPADAQTPLPALNAVAVDNSGSVVLFYPEDWRYTPQANGFSVASSAITILVETAVTSPLTFDEIPQWMQKNLGIPDASRFQRKTYGEVTGWLAQGVFSGDVYTAVVVLPMSDRQQIVLRSDSRADSLSQDAPLITAILDKMILLPTGFESLNLPVNWVLAEREDGVLLAPNADNLQQSMRGETPLLLAATLSTINQTLDELLSTEAPAEQRRFIVNGRPAMLQLRLNMATQTPELFIAQDMGSSVLVLTASAENGDNLVRFLPHLQAIFASATVN